MAQPDGGGAAPGAAGQQAGEQAAGKQAAGEQAAGKQAAGQQAASEEGASEAGTSEEEARRELDDKRRVLLLNMYPAATKKTGSYVEPPMFEPIDKRDEESWEQYEERKKEERKRVRRPRKKTGGWCFAFPDLCYLPTDPPMLLPFPNWGYLKDAIKCVTLIQVEGKPIVVETSEIPKTTGDEPGRQGGIMSGTTAAKVNFLEYSSKIFVQGKAIVYLTCKTAHNNYNARGKFIKPAQKKVWVTP